MKLDSKASNWQDWTIFSLRWVYLAAVGLAAYVYAIQPYTARNTAVPTSEILGQLALPLVIAGAVNLLYAAVIVTPSLGNVRPYIVIASDWVMTGALIALSKGEPLLVVGIAGVIIVAGMLRLGAVLGAVQAVGTLVVAAATLMVSLGIKDTNAFMTTYFPSFLLVLVLASAVGAWVYMQEEHLESQRRQFDKTVNYSSAQISDMQERARAFTEMANALSSTLNFEKILDAALNIGYLSLKKNLEDRHQRKPRMVSMVLLFENQGNVLSVFTSRGMKSVDDHRVIHGQEGIVAQALTEAIPMLGKNAAKDSELSTFASFAGILSTLVVPLRSGFDNFGVLVYGCDLPNAFGSDNIETLQALGTQATIALRNAVLYSNLMQEREKIVEMEENARKALVRDLHDLPAQTIAAIMMRIQIISKLLQKDPSSVPAELKIVEDMAKRVNDEIRHVLFSLRPLALESQGLTTALNQLADKMQNTFNQPVRIRIGHDIEQITSSHQQGIIFYLIEEAVNNARKYAKASLIRVSVERQGEMLVIQINDNGIGFDTGAVNEKYAQGKSASFGMVNMRERAALLDGTIQIESARGRGTTITVVIPVKPREDKPITQRNREAIPSTKLAQAAMDNFNNSLRSPRR